MFQTRDVHCVKYERREAKARGWRRQTDSQSMNQRSENKITRSESLNRKQQFGRQKVEESMHHMRSCRLAIGSMVKMDDKMMAVSKELESQSFKFNRAQGCIWRFGQSNKWLSLAHFARSTSSPSLKPSKVMKQHQRLILSQTVTLLLSVTLLSILSLSFVFTSELTGKFKILT